MARRPAPRPRFRPLADLLEARDCPAIDVFQEGPFLYLVGDRADDAVTVADLGGNVVQVQIGRGTETYSGITQIVAGMGGGDDWFEFQWGVQPSPFQDVRVDLGAGDDRFLLPAVQVDPHDPNADRSTLRLEVRAGGGHDGVTIEPIIPAGLDLFVGVDLGAGDDSLTSSMTPWGTTFDMPDDSPPSIDVEVSAGGGNDDIHVAIIDPDQIGDPNERTRELFESVSVTIGGGGGDDAAIIIVDGVDVSGALFAKMNTGGGDDAAIIVVDGVPAGETLVAVSLGGGNDSGLVGFHEVDQPAGPLTLQMDGGAGADYLLVRVGFNPQPDPPGSTAVAGPVQIGLDGGAGDDAAIIVVDGVPAGETLVAVSLGGGNDFGLVGYHEVDQPAGPVDLLMEGGAGTDNLVVQGELSVPSGRSAHTFLLEGGSGDDRIDASGLVLRSDQPDVVGISGHGGPGEDVLIGTNGKDQLRGHEGDDVLLGEGGNDELDGGLGSDHLFGGDGDDILISGRHLIGNTDDFATDYLNGGAGADIFYLGVLDSALDFDQQEGDQFGS